MAKINKNMQAKRELIMGIANKQSIAAAMARACHQHGSELAFSYQSKLLVNV